MKIHWIFLLLLIHQGIFAQDSLIRKSEKHFKNLRQLTFSGDNAEAYFSFDGNSLVYQYTDVAKNIPCDQIYFGLIPATDDISFQPFRISNGFGRTTCAYFMPGDTSVIFASTHFAGTACPPVPDREKYKKYVWPIYASMDIFEYDLLGNPLRRLTNTPGYDAEAVVSPNGDKIIFTSMRNGDLDLYTMNMDGSDVKRITYEVGYDGGAWFSPDGKKIVWRASRPKTAQEIKEYEDLLAEGLVMPTKLEIFTANVDGTNVQQITHLGQANWAPNWCPDGKHIIFSSNHEHPRGFPFNLYKIDIDGNHLEKISDDNSFDAFPMFSPDGKKLIFSSNRNNGGGHGTNLFICDWVD